MIVLGRLTVGCCEQHKPKNNRGNACHHCNQNRATTPAYPFGFILQRKRHALDLTRHSVRE
jgi:hypothetical protein